MQVVRLEHPHHRKHFHFFRDMNHPHFSVCAPIVVSRWVSETKRRGLRLTSSLVYLLARAANEVRQMRWRLRGDEIVEHEAVHPSFAVTTDEADVFSFCEVPYDADLPAFVAASDAQIEARRAEPSMEDEEGRDDYLFMSVLPWIAFTSVTHAMRYHPHDSVPRITWGKLEERDGRLMMPVSIQAHHALVDGHHVGAFFRGLEVLERDATRIFDAPV